MTIQDDRVAVDDGTVVGRAVAILDVVAEAAGPVRLAELTRLTGIPKPTAYRIAGGLVTRGMLAYGPAGYGPGERLLKQGLHAAARGGAAAAAQPYLQDLHGRSRGEVAWFGAFLDGDFRPVATVFGSERAAVMRQSSMPTFRTLGASVVLTASGRLLVAHRPELADRVRRAGCGPLTRYSTVDPRRLGALLDQAVETGFSHEQEQARLGCNCAAALVTDTAGAALGVIGVTSFSGRSDTRKLRGALLAAAASLRVELTTVPLPAPWRQPDPGR